MAICKWCGKSSKINQHGYCEVCNASIRNGIIRQKEILENLAAKSHAGLSQSEKDQILVQARETIAALEIYKERDVPFFKSDVSEMLRAVETRLTMPKGAVAFRSLSIDGKAKKSITLEKNAVKIIRHGSLLAATREKSIPIRQISGVEVKKPGGVIVGFIQIQTAGQQIASSSFKYTGGAYDAHSDENSVLFSDMEDYKTAISIKEYIENYGD